MITADWMSIEVPALIGALGYIWVAAVTFLWSCDLIGRSWSLPCPVPRHPFWRRLSYWPRLQRWLHKVACQLARFQLWLGIALFVGDAVLYGLLGSIFFLEGGTTDLWIFLVLVIGSVAWTIAFVLWSLEQKV
jgi:hypothetical protein